MGSIPALSILRGEHRPPGFDPTLHRLLESRLASWGARTALLPARTSFAQLDAAASRLARGICRRGRNLGVEANKDGDCLLAVSMEPSDRLLVTLLAAWKAGAAYLPLDPSFPASRVRHIVQEARPVLLIADTGEEPLHAPIVQLF
uniref:AMP-dependent synthetase/ligase domain-containing protein n=1 Tax=Timema monikensis TaxID=170555 RepID=A0A7R9HT36_9NEOP|nr:unnamed protein product [Timema monikensis]